MTQLLAECDLPAEAPLFAETDPTADSTQHAWHVLHTRSRQEKVVADDLIAMHIAHFLPLRQQVRFYGRRKVTVAEPLFPGYVFLRGSLNDVYRIDRTRRIARIIPVNDQKKLRRELRSIHVALSRKVPLDPYPCLKEGVRVVVKGGPLQGVEGLIQHRWATNRLILQVGLVGASSLEIDGSLLEVLD